MMKDSRIREKLYNSFFCLFVFAKLKSISTNGHFAQGVALAALYKRER